MLYSGFNISPCSGVWSADFNGRSDNLDVITLNKTQGTILDMYAPLVTIASLVFCLAGIVLLFLFSVEVFVAWYSGVQHEPPRTQFQILAEGVQMAIVCSATITVFFWWFLPSIRS